MKYARLVTPKYSLTSRLLAALMVCATVLPVAPIVNIALPIRFNILYLLIAGMTLLVLIAAGRRLKPPRYLWIVVWLTIIFGAMQCIYWGVEALRALSAAGYFVITACIVSMVRREEVVLYAEYMTWVLIIVCMGAVGGLVYSLGGGAATLEIVNPDGRPAWLFATTMTNAVTQFGIRPAGIFDEPGALALFSMATVCLREAVGARRRDSVILAGLSVATLSLASLVAVSMYVAVVVVGDRNFRWRTILMIVGVGGLVAVAVLSSAELFIGAGEYLLGRVNALSENPLGDSRSSLFERALSVTSVGSIVFGLDPSCIQLEAECTNRFGLFGENPLSPALQFGLGGAASYYVVMILLMRRRGEGIVWGVSLIMFALLIQRPYVFQFGYVMLVGAFVRALSRWTVIGSAREATPVFQSRSKRHNSALPQVR